MTDQSTQLQQLLSNTAIQEAVKSIGPMPFLGSGWTPATPVLDPNAIASEIFGFRVDFENRESLLDALKSAFPIVRNAESGEPIVGHRQPFESVSTPAGGLPLVGPLAAAAAALQALWGHAAKIDEIKPLNPCSGDTCCDHEPLIVLVRDTIRDLVRQFATGRPLVQQVDVLVSTLYIDTCTGPAAAADRAVGGYLGELGERCGMDCQNICSFEHEKIFSNYTALVALTGMFADAWKEARGYNDGKFLTIGIQDLRRHLVAVVGGLGRLRALVPAEAWATTEIDDPPIVAAEFWNWMHQYSGTTAMTMLQQGRDGIFGVNKTMCRFSDVLSRLVHEDYDGDYEYKGRKRKNRDDKDAADRSDDYRHTRGETADYCAGVPNAFDDDEVQDVIREMLCQVQRIIKATECDDPAGIGTRRRAVPHAIEPKPTRKPAAK